MQDIKNFLYLLPLKKIIKTKSLDRITRIQMLLKHMFFQYMVYQNNDWTNLKSYPTSQSACGTKFFINAD